MKKIDKEMVLLLHQLMAQATGGSIGVRDDGLLESALESCFATFDGQELYPTKIEKAAKLGYSLVSNHAFIDGNKRIGIYVMLTFLEINGIKISAENQDIVNIGLSLANGTMKYQDLVDWLKIHIK